MVTLLTQARRFPILATLQVIIIKEAQEMVDLKNTKGQKLLLHYLDHPQSTTLIVFAYKYKTIYSNTPLGKALLEKNFLITSKKLYKKQLYFFIKSFVKNLKLDITEQAILLLENYIGNDLTRITSELHKLYINLTPNSIITNSIIDTYISMDRTFNIFEIKKAIMQRDYTTCYKLMHIWLSDTNTKEYTALSIVMIIYNIFSKLLILYQTKEKILSKIADQINVTHYSIKEYLNAMQNYTFHEVINNIIYLHQTDLQLKGINSNLSDYQIMKVLIFKIMHS